MSETFAELFEESFASRKIVPGSIINGTVVAINDDVVIVSAGLKSEAVIPIEQFKNDKREGELAVGDTVEVALDAVEDGFGETKLSREKAIRARTWIDLEKAYEKG
jgi:small subunit ribosomal protein S1